MFEKMEHYSNYSSDFFIYTRHQRTMYHNSSIYLSKLYYFRTVHLLPISVNNHVKLEFKAQILMMIILVHISVFISK